MPGAELAAGMANQAQAFLIQVKMLHLAVVNCSTSRIFATPLQMFLTISFADQSGTSSLAAENRFRSIRKYLVSTRMSLSQLR